MSPILFPFLQIYIYKFEFFIVFRFLLILLFLFCLACVGGTTGDGTGPVIEIEGVTTEDPITVCSHSLPNAVRTVVETVTETVF